MNAFMYPDTARALLAQSRAFTLRKRAEREQAKAFAEALEQFERIGFKGEAARELAQIHVKGQQ
jgi:hypothetical protein